MTKTSLVLLIDDDKFQLEILSELLRELGVAEVLTASNGMQGIALFESLERKPDLLLCDLQMPEMDGIEFLRDIAAHNYQGVISVISSMEADLLKAATNCANAYGINMLESIKKPVDRDKLHELLLKAELIKPRKIVSVREELVLSYEELRTGLQEGHLEVFFQPKVAVADYRMVGVECLARWRHPERGLLGPNAFIAAAEEHGLIDELTLAVLRQAVGHLAAWHNQGNDCKVAVNLSTDNLTRLDLPEIIQRIVQDAGIDSKRIVLEITESGLTKDFQLSLDILTRLRLKGFSLSVDDYGTGYSNMKKLKQLPFSELKIDRTFVCGASGDTTTRAILESSVRLGKTLGMNLVAEGVETQEDWDLVAELGCDEVQGYFIARPMPANELCVWKKEWEENMNNNDNNNDNFNNGSLPRILNVDDDLMMRELTKDELSQSFHVLAAKNGEECLAMLKSNKVDLILLDVEMPGIDGYETCRRLKDSSDTAEIPVIFLSGHDGIEDRIRGYESGGDDYILKPFEGQELKVKIQHLLRLCQERAQHKEMAQYATNTAMTAMTSLGEMGVLIETMKKFNACNTLSALIEACLVGLAHYGLQGVVQIRTTTDTLTLNENGAASPLEVSVINHMTSNDRITSFKSRMCVTYDRVSMLINNMPANNPDCCGRLRDHLAMMVEGANVRVQAIMLGNALNHVIENLSKTLADIDRAQRQSKTTTYLNLNTLNDDITRAYISLGMTDAQEDFLSQVIKNGIDRIIDDETSNLDFQDKLSSLIKELKQMRNSES